MKLFQRHVFSSGTLRDDCLRKDGSGPTTASMRATGRQKSKPVFAFGKSRRSVGKILGTMAVASVLALTTITSHAAAGEAVFLYGPGGAYYAAGYTVTGGGTVADPLGVTIGTVNGQGVITDSNGNVIGYVTVE